MELYQKLDLIKQIEDRHWFLLNALYKVTENYDHLDDDIAHLDRITLCQKIHQRLIAQP